MKLTFINPGFEYSVDSILLFQTEDETPYWSDTLLYFYPHLDAAQLRGHDSTCKKAYLMEALAGTYASLEPEINGKIERYAAHWSKYNPQIEDALSEAFDLDTRSLFNDIVAGITLNPVCPRFLNERRFDIFHKNSERGALGIAIHEIIHFLWFYVWHRRFGDSYEEYETPSLKWILSEMVVESIMRDERLSRINPYFPRENGGCVYGYFQDMIIDGAFILETLDHMYRRMSIADFMQESYRYCERFEPEIRKHIHEAERAF